jgi:hypothetical protein
MPAHLPRCLDRAHFEACLEIVTMDAETRRREAEQLRIPPHSVEAESSVLGALLLDGGAWDHGGNLLVESDFYGYEHRLIFAAICALITLGRPADVITVYEHLRGQGEAEEVGELPYLNSLAQYVPSAVNIRRYAEIVREHAARRELVAEAEAISSAAFSPNGQPLVDMVQDAQQRLTQVARRLPLSALAQQIVSWCWAADLPPQPEAEEQIVEGVIGRFALSMLYGDTNCGKTFLGIDIGCAVALGKPWMGRQTMRGLVVYLATESPRSVRMRLQAYQRHHGVKVTKFAIVQSPINLYDGSADAMAVVNLIRALEAETGEKCELVIGDTLSRMAAGANENSGEDMGTVLAHLDLIRTEANTHVMLIHHCGKDAARGARGWSGMRAAIDTEIEVTVDEVSGAHAAEITKQRDIPGKGDRIGFRLEPVEMGVGQWGKLRTSCVVVATDAPVKHGKGKRLSEIAGAIVEVLGARGTGMKKAALVEHLKDRYPTKASVYREIKKLVEAGRLHESVGIVTLRKDAVP